MCLYVLYAKTLVLTSWSRVCDTSAVWAGGEGASHGMRDQSRLKATGLFAVKPKNETKTNATWPNLVNTVTTVLSPRTGLSRREKRAMPTDYYGGPQ